jgi:hypothetical protein
MALREIAALFDIDFNTAPLKKGEASIDATKKRIAQLTTALRGLRAGDPAIAKTTAELEKMKDQLKELEAAARVPETFQEQFERIGKATAPAIAAIGAVVYGLVSFVNGLASTGEQLTEAAAKINVTTDQLQSMRHAFASVGVGTAEADTALAGLVSHLQAAATGGGDAARSIARLGIHVRDAHHHIRPVSELLPLIATRMDRITDPAERVRVAVGLFGDAGRRLEPILRSGAGGVAELQTEIEALGGGMSGEAIEAARKYTVGLERLRVSALSLQSTIGVFLLPLFERVTNWFARAVATVNQITRHTHVFEVALAALGAVGVVVAAALYAAWLPVIAPFAAAALAVGAIILLVDDLWTAFEGGDSAIGRIVDATLGVNSMRDAVAGARIFWMELVGWIEAAADANALVIQGFERIANIVSGGRVGISAAEAQQQNVDMLANRAKRTRDREFREQNIINGPRAQHAVRDRGETIDDAGNNLGRLKYAVQDAIVTLPRGMAAAPGASGPEQKAGMTVVHSGATTNHFNITGQNPLEIARQIERVMTRRERDQADSNHPQEQNES